MRTTDLRLKIAIVASGKSQRQVAASCRPPIPESRLSDIVRGWTKARPEEREALADALTTSVAALFGVDEPSSEPQRQPEPAPAA